MNTSHSFCAACGKPLSSNAAFCEYCGTPVGASAQPAPRSKKAFPTKKVLLIGLPVLAVVCLGGIVLLLVTGVLTYSLMASPRTQQTGPTFPADPTATRALSFPQPVVPTLPTFQEPAPTQDLGALAASFVSIDFDPSTCSQDSIGSYNFRGTVTNTSDQYSIANIVLGGKLINSNEDIVQWGIGSPEAAVIRPGNTVDFWFWIDWYHLEGFRCEVYLRSAEIAEQ